MEKPVVPVGKQMERFVPTENFRKKSNTFRGITFFSLLPKRQEFSVPFVHITRPDGYCASANSVTPRKMADTRETSYVSIRPQRM